MTARRRSPWNTNGARRDRHGRRRVPRSSRMNGTVANIRSPSATKTQNSTSPVNGDKQVETSAFSVPVYRRLRGYAFDPSLSVRLDTAVINQTIYKIPWEDRSE